MFGSTTSRAAGTVRRPMETIRRSKAANQRRPGACDSSDSRHVKVVLIGDGAVGKTSLLTRYASNEFNPKHEPTIFENCSLDRVIDGRKVELALWDNAGQEEFDKIRLLSYSNIDVFVIVFSINNWEALHNVKTKWMPEITDYAHGVPLLLIGSKCDLRRVPGTQTLSHDAGVNLAREINAVAYMECSAKTSEGCTTVFEQAVREALATQDLRRTKYGKQKPTTMKKNMPQRCCVLC